MDNRHNSPRLSDHRSADLENLPDYHDQSSRSLSRTHGSPPNLQRSGKVYQMWSGFPERCKFGGSVKGLTILTHTFAASTRISGSLAKTGEECLSWFGANQALLACLKTLITGEL